jgi:uncharacterized protein YutE (UPF0331/DUF86 family)
MMTGQMSTKVIADRLAWIAAMLGEIRALPLDDSQAFFADSRNVWAAESCLRRALEALLDLGRYILAKGFGHGVTEYKETALRLGERGVLQPAEVEMLRQMAGYRNRIVHFYHEVSQDELYQICAQRLGDIERVVDALRRWIQSHPDQMNGTL